MSWLSWLAVRTRPTSVAEPARRVVVTGRAPRWSCELHDGVAHLQLVAPLHDHRTLHLLAVEVGAVGGTEVLHEQLTVAREDPRVDLARVGVVQGDLAAGRAAHGELLRQGEGAALLGGRFD